MKNQTIEKNQIQIFNHEQFGEITIIRSENGKVLFKANDVAKALGYTNNAKVKVIWDENAADLYTLDGKYIMTCLPAMKAVQSHAELNDDYANGLDHQIGRKKSQTKAIDEFEMALNDAFQELGYSQSMAFGGNKESYNCSQIETETKKINNKQTKTKQRVDRDFNESEWS